MHSPKKWFQAKRTADMNGSAMCMRVKSYRGNTTNSDEMRQDTHPCGACPTSAGLRPNVFISASIVSQAQTKARTVTVFWCQL